MREREPRHQKFFEAMSSRIEESAAAAIDGMDQILGATRNMADVVVARTNRLQAAVLVLSVAVIALTVVQLVVALND